METVIFSFGVVLFLLGLIGRVEAREIKVGTDQVPARVIAAVIGVVFTLLALGRSGYLSQEVPVAADSPPPTVSWEGTWNTAWGTSINDTPSNIVVVFETAAAGEVVGSYEYLDPERQQPVRGRIEGQASGARLNATWEERGEGTLATGKLEFLAFADGASFVGRFLDAGTPESKLWWTGEREQD